MAAHQAVAPVAMEVVPRDLPPAKLDQPITKRKRG